MDTFSLSLSILLLYITLMVIAYLYNIGPYSTYKDEIKDNMFYPLGNTVKLTESQIRDRENKYRSL